MEAVERHATSQPVRAGRHVEFRRGIRDSLPILVGFIPFGLVLGAQASRHGLGPVEVGLMTGLNFAGGSEFAAIALWASPPSILLIAAVTLLVNSRHLLMGAILAPMLQHLPRRKALAALFVMCDESWALGLADAQRGAGHLQAPLLNLPYYWGIAAPLLATWLVSTVLGAIVGPVIGDIEAYGLHMAFPAVFLVLMRGMWKGMRAARPWLISLAVAVASYLLAPGAWYVLTGTLGGVLAGYWMADDVQESQP